MKTKQIMMLNLGLISSATLLGCDTPGCEKPGEFPGLPYCLECWAKRPENECKGCHSKNIPQMEYKHTAPNYCQKCQADNRRMEEKDKKTLHLLAEFLRKPDELSEGREMFEKCLNEVLKSRDVFR